MAKQFRFAKLLPWLNLVAAVITCLVIFSGRDWLVRYKPLARQLDIISRMSVLWFLPTYAARPLNDLLHRPATRWLVKNRRYLGLSFAAWFLQHLWLLPLMASREPVFSNFWAGGRFMFPGVTLTLATVLAVTSFDRAQRSMPGWHQIHWVTMQLLWVWFFAIYTKFYFVSRHETYQLVYITLFVVALALRVGSFVRKRSKKPRTAPSPLAVVLAFGGGIAALVSVTLVSYVRSEMRPAENYIQAAGLAAVAVGIVLWQLRKRPATAP